MVVGWRASQMSGAGIRACAAYDKKRTNTAESSELAPAGYFTAVLSVFQAHLPVHDYDGHAKPLDWRVRARNQTIQIRWLADRKIDWLDSCSASCHRLSGC